MESFLNRYRNISVLLLVIVGQLILLAVQVKNDQDVRMIRVWAVTAVTPVARLVESIRGGSSGLIHNYFVLRETGEENRRLREEVGRLRMENNFLKNELATADRAKALQVFQTRTPSKTLAANVIGVGAGANSKTVFVNRGFAEGVRRGMAVVTPDGIVGKVIGAYPVSSEVLLVTDPEFAAGVMSQSARARGTLKGQGSPNCKIDYVPYEDKVEVGDWFYASGDDRIFPRGFPVGVVKSVRPGQPFKEILLEPSALQQGLEDVLIVITPVHQDIPEAPQTDQPVFISSAPPATTPDAATAAPPAAGATEADRLRNMYKSTGDAQGHVFGGGGPGSKPPDFTKLGQQPATTPAGAPNGTQKQPPAGSPNSAPKQPAAAPPGTSNPAPKQPTATPSGAPSGAPNAAPKQPRTANPTGPSTGIGTPNTAPPKQPAANEPPAGNGNGRPAAPVKPAPQTVTPGGPAVRPPAPTAAPPTAAPPPKANTGGQVPR